MLVGVWDWLVKGTVPAPEMLMRGDAHPHCRASRTQAQQTAQGGGHEPGDILLLLLLLHEPRVAWNPGPALVGASRPQVGSSAQTLCQGSRLPQPITSTLFSSLVCFLQ